jgi:AraC family transcriptional regulator
MLRLTIHPKRYSAGVHQPRHAHDELHLSLVLRGSVAEDIGSERHIGSALSVVTKDPGAEHANTFGPDGATLVRLSCPVSLAAIAGPGADVHRPAQWFHDPAVARPFLRLWLRSRSGEFAFHSADDDVVDLVSRLLPVRCTPGGAPPQWLRDVYAQVADDHHRVSAASLASSAGVHPVYLARALRRWYGANLRTLVLRRRLCNVAHRLASTQRTVSQIAHDTSFADEPHLCRRFRAATGTTPAAFRRLTELT